MSVARGFLESLSKFAEITLNSPRNNSYLTYQFSNFLFAAFEFGKAKTHLSNDDAKTAG